MSYSIDANLLLNAANRDSDVHDAALRLLEQCAERDEPLCLTWSAINAFLEGDQPALGTDRVRVVAIDVSATARAHGTRC